MCVSARMQKRMWIKLMSNTRLIKLRGDEDDVKGEGYKMMTEGRLMKVILTRKQTLNQFTIEGISCQVPWGRHGAKEREQRA